MTAALSLADQDFPVHLVEKTSQLGGNLRNIHFPIDDRDPQDVLARLLENVQNHSNIRIHLESKIASTSGFKGNFSSVIQTADGNQKVINHGVSILATGAQEYRGPDYGYGSTPQIVTQQEFEVTLSAKHGKEALPESVPRWHQLDAPGPLPHHVHSVFQTECQGAC